MKDVVRALNYYALFLENNNYVEKCLTLIRYISNSQSYSLPHVTIRVFESSNTKLEYVKDIRVSYLNIIEPGSFNIDNNKSPVVVYLRCESEELENIEYKPDFPFSRLHITLYEGSDIDYAQKLYRLLSNNRWHFKLLFKEERALTERKIGSKKFPDQFLRTIETIFSEVIGGDFNEFLRNIENNDYKLSLVGKVLDKLYNYLLVHNETIRIESYFSTESIKNSKNYVDASKDIITYNVNQLSFDSFHSNKAPYVEKPVQDAIYVTPPEYARDMAKCALDVFGDSRKIDFGDPAVGTGALYLALKHLVDESKGKTGSINSAIGIEIDKRMAKEAFIRCGKRGLTVIYGDALLLNLESLGTYRNLMLVNPPYNRHEDIPKEYKLQARNLAKKQTGIEVMGDAGLYVYHMLIMDKWLESNGIAVWLLPSIFLQSRYGEAIRKYLLNNVQLLKLHIYDDEKIQFENTYISTTIVVFKKNNKEELTNISVSYGESVTEPHFSTVVEKGALHEAFGNWRGIIYNKGKKWDQSLYNSNNIKFEDIFNIKRGLATGANSFFVLERNEARKLGIPDVASKPLLPKARYLESLIIESQKDGYPDIKSQLVLIDCDLDEELIRVRYPDFFDYLQDAKKGEKPIIKRTLVRSRKPWYKQEKRDAAPFLLTYMGRNKKNVPPLYFILNKSKALALNTYLLLYPKEWLSRLLKENNNLYEAILTSLNKSAEIVIAQQTRVYSGGLQKLEPGELKKLPIVCLPDEIIKAYREKSDDNMHPSIMFETD